jgi:hypothetical protein
MVAYETNGRRGNGHPGTELDDGAADRLAPVRSVEDLPVPNVCVVGNHDLDDAGGEDAWAQVHGPMNFDFAHGNTHFVAIDGAPGELGGVVVPVDGPIKGPREEALAFLERSLEAADAPQRVV